MTGTATPTSTPSFTVGPGTQAQKVREELFRATGQQQWNRDDYWKFYLKGRREILDAVYNDISDKDWLNPAIADRVEAEFARRAQKRWGGPNERWVLEGRWMEERRDILAWMRSTFWKHNKNRMAGKVVQELASPDSTSEDTRTRQVLQESSSPDGIAGDAGTQLVLQELSNPDDISGDARTQLAGKVLQELSSPDGTSSGDAGPSSSSPSSGFSGQPYSSPYIPAAEKNKNMNLVTATECGRTWRDVMLE